MVLAVVLNGERDAGSVGEPRRTPLSRTFRGDPLYAAHQAVHTQGPSLLTDKHAERLWSLLWVDAHAHADIEVEALSGIYQPVITGHHEPDRQRAES